MPEEVFEAPAAANPICLSNRPTGPMGMPVHHHWTRRVFIEVLGSTAEPSTASELSGIRTRECLVVPSCMVEPRTFRISGRKNTGGIAVGARRMGQGLRRTRRVAAWEQKIRQPRLKTALAHISCPFSDMSTAAGNPAQNLQGKLLGTAPKAIFSASSWQSLHTPNRAGSRSWGGRVSE